MSGNTRTSNAVIDLTIDSDCETIEAPRHVRGPTTRSQTRRALQSQESNAKRSGNPTKTNDNMVVTKTTIQSSCPVCLRKLEKIKSEDGLFCVTSCGHLFCIECINMVIETRRKIAENGKRYIKCPTCGKELLAHSKEETDLTKVYL